MGGFCKNLFQRANPWRQQKLGITADKEVKVIGHDYIDADRDVEVCKGALSESNKCRMDLI
ncbi:MAG: hypothetical protein QOJ05_1016 [Verrucomicrobiota bacterium]|jgi:hypothetical protein